MSAITEQQERELQELARDPHIYEKLTASLGVGGAPASAAYRHCAHVRLAAPRAAPSIWEMNDVKKGILCQLFGGANKPGGGSAAAAVRLAPNAVSVAGCVLCGPPPPVGVVR